MDKTVLKNFAIESRKDLMEKIDRKIKLFYVGEEFKKENKGDVIVLSNDKHTLTLTKEENSNRDRLLKRIIELGYERVVEEAAYTWFNRLVAIRYMEIHDYLPLTSDNQSIGVKVLSSDNNSANPDIMKFTILSNPNLDINFNKEKYAELTTTDEKFKYVLLLICRKLGKVIPQVFDGITDYIELLIPDNMLGENGFIYKLINNISVSNFYEVEIIGWLYQYYNQTEKDKAMAKKGVYSKEEIPYVTQLFTPDWIVKYMIDNTLGKYYLNSDSKNEQLKYLINDKNTTFNNVDIKTIKFIDPCSGSGHILIYAFDIFYKIYIECGYNKNDIAENILKNNLYGLDIDDRAGQLSILSVILKAREYDKNIFNKEIIKNINICSIQESSNINLSFFDDNKIQDSNVKYLVEIFKKAKEIGSLLKVDYKDYSMINTVFGDNIIGLSLIEQITPLIKQAEILSNKYDIVVTNPPYLPNSKMSDVLKKYLAIHYNNSKLDLCTAFMETGLLKNNGYLGMINMHSWMFLPSFENLRREIINNKYICSLLHLGPHAFEEISGEVVQNAAFIIKNSVPSNELSIYIRLIDYTNYKDKEEQFISSLSSKNNWYIKNTKDFNDIPGLNLSYWLSKHELNLLSGEKVSDYGSAKQGIATGDNDRFLREWYEVNFEKTSINKDEMPTNYKWIPYNKGGTPIKWYGNYDYVVNWENDGFEIKNFYSKDGKLRSRPQNLDYIFRESITWSLTSSNSFNVRLRNAGSISDINGMSLFLNNTNYENYFLGLLNSKQSERFLNSINPTMANQSGDVMKIPVIIGEDRVLIEQLVKDNIDIAKNNWDLYEESWDFKTHPFLNYSQDSIESSFKLYKSESDNNFAQLKKNEELLNDIFIRMYGLNKIIDSHLDDSEITYKKANLKKDIKSLISYAVGCIFGRYSLDDKGLIFAGEKFDISKYKKFIPDEDNIIPIADSESVYYNDDIIGKFKEFIKVAFGTETLNDNLNFIADNLGKKGTESSEDTIRRYFVNDFYNEHVKIYQKRPIYWLFDSGKKNGFKCLMYLHRYDEQIVSKIRTKYLHNTLSIYQRTVEEIDYKLNNEALSTTDKRELQNKKADLNGKITECNEYEEMVGNVANKMIKLDLDDGVINNYAKFVDDNGKSILAKIK